VPSPPINSAAGWPESASKTKFLRQELRRVRVPRIGSHASRLFEGSTCPEITIGDATAPSSSGYERAKAVKRFLLCYLSAPNVLCTSSLACRHLNPVQLNFEHPIGPRQMVPLTSWAARNLERYSCSRLRQASRNDNQGLVISKISGVCSVLMRLNKVIVSIGSIL